MLTHEHYSKVERKAVLVALFVLGCYSLAWMPTLVHVLILRDVYAFVWWGSLAGMAAGTATSGTGFVMRYIAIGFAS